MQHIKNNNKVNQKIHLMIANCAYIQLMETIKSASDKKKQRCINWAQHADRKYNTDNDLAL